jgi:predicted naringenin-chalcone synthase
MAARVSIRRVAVAHPELRILQEEAAARIGAATGHPRQAAALARGTHIRQRATCLPPDQIGALGSIEERNRLYARHAPGLALAAAKGALEGVSPENIGCLVTSSCTGYMVPGWDIDLVLEMSLACDTVRLPITQAGCSGGALGLARAADYLRVRGESEGLAVACELCSLAFQATAEEGNLTSTLIFGDGAGAARLTSDVQPGDLEIIDSVSLLAPAPPEVLGFDLTDRGFYPLLGRELVGVLPPATTKALGRLLEPHGLAAADVEFWLLHPGGARILSQLQESLGLAPCLVRWSWESMEEFGNTSSAAIFDVVRRYLADCTAPGGWGVIAAFGPGVSVEMLLVKRC